MGYLYTGILVFLLTSSCISIITILLLFGLVNKFVVNLISVEKHIHNHFTLTPPGMVLRRGGTGATRASAAINAHRRSTQKQKETIIILPPTLLVLSSVFCE